MTTIALTNGSLADALALFLSPDSRLRSAVHPRSAAFHAPRDPRANQPDRASVVSLVELGAAAFDEQVDYAFTRLERGLL
jgi:hypothetical protein